MISGKLLNQNYEISGQLINQGYKISGKLLNQSYEISGMKWLPFQARVMETTKIFIIIFIKFIDFIDIWTLLKIIG
jgi:hypothetical protein